MQSPAKKRLSPEEYLALEQAAENKSEFYNGEIFAMAGTSINHNQIILNISSHCHQAQELHKCRVFVNDLRLWIEYEQFFTYPDLMILCDKPQFYPDRNDTVINPGIIIEVLSKSTEAYDRGKKFQFYRSIPTFQEYILVDQYSVHIDQFYLDSEKKWSFTDYNTSNDILKFSKINFELSLEKIYHLVDFE